MFIAVDLKVIEGLAAAVARSSGVSEEAVGWGLVRLWHRCWADEIDHLDRSEMAGIFGLQNLDLVTSALEAFGFLETQKAAAGWRVRGAARYLRLKESRRRGAVATNAKKARSKANGSDAQSRSRASTSDAQSRSLTESPNTEHRTLEDPAGKKPAEPNPRHAPMVTALTQAYTEETRGSRYGFTPRDAKHVQQLLALSPDDAEILFKWRTALRASFFDQFHTPKTRTLSDLVRDWNAYTAINQGVSQ